MRKPLPLIACTLDGEGQRARLREWTELLGHAEARARIAGGVRYAFAAADGLEPRIRALAAAEEACCAFLEFDVSRTGERIEMTVTAPAEGLDALRFIFSS
jgi:MerR family copper efflux transcriptional regulator